MKILQVFTILPTAVSFFDGQLRYLADQGNEIHVVSDSPEDPDFTNRNRIVYHRLPIARSISPTMDIKSIRLLANLMRRENFDMVIGHTPKGALVAMMASKLAGVKNRVYYRHGLIYTTAQGVKRKVFKAVERLTAYMATSVVNVSNSLSRLAVADGLNPDAKQYVIGKGTCGGIDTKRTFNPDLVDEESVAELKRSLGLDPEDYVVGFCGRLCKDKGVRELVDGFKLLRKRNENVKLLLVGPYDTRDILPEEYKKEIESNPDIIATGRIAKNMLPLYYQLMDVFVLPSYREGFGMSVLEASAMNKPVLVSRSHGCVDSIVEGETGLYIDISPEDIAAQIECVKGSTNSYGVKGRKWVCENFDSESMWPKVSSLLDELCLK